MPQLKGKVVVVAVRCEHEIPDWNAAGVAACICWQHSLPRVLALLVVAVPVNKERGWRFASCTSVTTDLVDNQVFRLIINVAFVSVDAGNGACS